MAFSYRAEDRDGRVLDVLSDDARGMRIIVSRLGAELISLARSEDNGATWRGFLYRDDDLTAPPSGWANHSTVMGYFLHRLRNGRSLYRGREISGGNHGFLREKTWEVSGDPVLSGRLTYAMKRTQFTAIEYPLDVSLELSYALEDDDVRVTFSFRNNEPELAAHVGFGLHPGFAAQTFESFEFEMPAGVYRRYPTRENFLSGEIEEIKHDGGPMPLPRAGLPGSYILGLSGVPDRQFRYTDKESGRSVEFSLADVPYLTLWSDGGPFLCVEPCWGLTDHFDQRAFEEKEGIQVIPPKSQCERSFVMRPRLL